MDYKHIEQLLERYWQCETSTEEENSLREFFMGNDVPKELEPYRDIFVYQSVQQKVEISSGFEERLFNAIEESSCKIKKVSFTTRIAPLFRAAVFVGVFLLVNNLAQQSMVKDEVLDYDYNAYKDTYTDPEIAYKKVSAALMILSEGLNKTTVQSTDSIEANRQEITEHEE